MLKRLEIRNFIFIKSADLEFDPHFNVITGETGAGKSILINALSITLGQKIDTAIISPGEDKIEVTSLFDIRDNQSFKKRFQAHGIGVEDEELILKREISKDGKSRCLLNGRITNLSTLKEIAERLIDIHSQHQNQQLFNSEHHLYFFDQTLNLKSDLAEFKKLLFQLKELRKTLAKLEQDAQNLAEEKDFLQYSLKELDGKLVSADDYEKLKLRLKTLEQGEKNQTLLAQFNELTNAQALPLLEKALRELEKISSTLEDKNNNKKDIEKLQNEITNNHEQLGVLIGDVLSAFNFKENQNFTYEIDEINQRLSSTEKLMRKHGLTVTELFGKLVDIKNKLGLLENLKFEHNKLNKAIEEIHKQILPQVSKLHQERIKGIKPFETAINKELVDLEIKNADFKLQLEPESFVESEMGKYLNDRGIDSMEFMFSPGKGMGYKQLKKIASGGEVSRIMLAIKHLLTKSLPNNTIVFDEIDVGVGGIAAVKIGQKIKAISKLKQVIVITHLPQIARYADQHFCIDKTITSKGSSVTSITTLNETTKIAEITRMLGKAVNPENLRLTEEFLK